MRAPDAICRAYDWSRTFRLAFFNGAIMGPLGHVYYNLLDSVRLDFQLAVRGMRTRYRTAFSSPAPHFARQSVMPHHPTSLGAVLSKLFIDQMMWAPLCTCFFYLYKCFAEGRPRCGSLMGCAVAMVGAHALPTARLSE